MHWKNRFKVLSALLFALAAVTAVGASAAQAEWRMKENGEAKLHAEASGNFSLVLIKTKKSTIHCETGLFGRVLVLLSEDHESAEVYVNGTLAKCTVKSASCSVSSPGAKLGEILFGGNGPMSTEGGTTYATLSGEGPLATLIFGGASCPLPEKETLTGSLKLTIQSAGEETVSHGIELAGEGLFLGKEAAVLEGKEGALSIPGKIEDSKGLPLSIAFI